MDVNWLSIVTTCTESQKQFNTNWEKKNKIMTIIPDQKILRRFFLLGLIGKTDD
jgi:hypothetical protein